MSDPYAGTTSYLYDANGNQIERTDPATANTPAATTLYLPGEELRLHTAGNLNATRSYTHNGQTIAMGTCGCL